jgi:hypothetical protein
MHFGTRLALAVVPPQPRRKRSAATRWAEFITASQGRDKNAMWNADPKTLIVLLALIQTAGIGSACLARWAAVSRTPGIFYAFFYGLLALAGVANVAALAVNTTFWLLSSFLLALMVLTATLDLGGSRRATVS